MFALAIYVDDCFLIEKKCKFLNVFKHDFSRSKTEDLGPAIWILGYSINRNRSCGTLHLVQTRYIKDVLQEFGMSDCNPVSTPILAKPHKLLDAKFNAKEMPFAKLIGKLLYVSNCTRPILLQVLIISSDICQIQILNTSFKQNEYFVT
jgi:hypothetical protein